MTTPTLTIIESPFAGQSHEHIQRNILYAHACMLDSIHRGETPFASHLLYPQVLDDTDPDERQQGLTLAQAYYPFAAQVVVYTDLGISGGMQAGIDLANSLGIPIVTRTLADTTSPHIAIIDVDQLNLTDPPIQKTTLQ